MSFRSLKLAVVAATGVALWTPTLAIGEEAQQPAPATEEPSKLDSGTGSPDEAAARSGEKKDKKKKRKAKAPKAGKAAGGKATTKE